MNTDVKYDDYKDLLRQVVAEIKSARVTAARKVNREMIMLYWSIGKLIVEKQLTHGYGQSVVERLSDDLKNEFPESTGFSSRNLWDMKRFYETYYHQDEILRQLVAELPWGHHLLILNKTKQIEEAVYYIKNAIEFAWSRDILLNQVKSVAPPFFSALVTAGHPPLFKAILISIELTVNILIFVQFIGG